jgi:hypothetical protein
MKTTLSQFLTLDCQYLPSALLKTNTAQLEDPREPSQERGSEGQNWLLLGRGGSSEKGEGLRQESPLRGTNRQSNTLCS